jgi:hypothetical protein
VKKYIKYIPAGSLILFGYFTEVFWYRFRFVSDGNSNAVAIAQGIALTIFLSVSVVIKNKVAKFALITGLVIYSVIATAAGQSYSLELVRLQSIREIQEQEQAQMKYDDLQSTIDINRREWTQLQEQKSSLSFEDQYEWKNTLARVNERIAELDTIIQQAQDEQIALIKDSDIKPDDVYTYYGDIIGVNPDVIQTILQLALSLFIALMAPVGIAIWPRSTPAEETKETINRTKLLEFVNAFFDSRSHLPPQTHSGLTMPEYGAAKKILSKLDLIKNRGGHWQIVASVDDAEKKIIEYKVK